MKKNRPLVWLIPLILLLMLIPFIVPSALTYAGAEEASALPAYSPVELANPHPDPLPMPNPKDQKSTPYQPHPDGYVYDPATAAAWEYRDGTIYVKIDTAVVNTTKVYFTWIQIADPTQMRCIVSGETQAVKLARNIGAVLAINGDWYTGRSEGIIIRNGVPMRKKENPFNNYDALIIDDEGNFHILKRPQISDFDPYRASVMHSFLFGPALVIDGELQTFDGNNYGSGAGMGLTNKTQRQAICQMEDLSYLIITTEGPNESKDGGFTMTEFAELAFEMGVRNAYNLDGGNSANLVLNGTRMNRFGRGGGREITDLLYFITAEPAPEPTEAPATETPVPADTNTEGSATP